jgi:hypothetical protein
MSAPTYSQNQSTLVGSPSSGTLAASGAVTIALDLRTVDVGIVEIPLTFGTVAATAGVTVSASVVTNGTTDTQTVAIGVIAATASTTQKRSFKLPTGQYVVTLTNLDATNAVTVGTPVLDTWVK